MDHLVIRRSRSSSNLEVVEEGIKLGLSLATDKNTELKIVCSIFKQAKEAGALRGNIGGPIFNNLNQKRQCSIEGVKTSLETFDTIKKSSTLFDGVCIALWPLDSTAEKLLRNIELCQALIVVEWVPGALDGYIEKNNAKLIEV